MEVDAGHNALGRVAVVVDNYPCLSESFVRRELARLKACGFTVAVVACGPARDGASLLREPREVVFRPNAAGRAAWLRRGMEALKDLRRAVPLFPRRPRGLAAAGRAALITSALRPTLKRWKPDWLHAHFAGMPAAVACLLSERLDVPFSISVHARDIFVPVARLASLCARARFVTACSEYAQASLMGRLPPELAERVVHFPHDVPCGSTVPWHDAHDDTLRILSVCRLVPKKGIDVVLRALALLRGEVRFRHRIVGDGPERGRLSALAVELGLDAVEFVGALRPEEVSAELARSDIFVLGVRTASDGDRDGIPNVVLEAMAAGVPVIVSDGGAVSEVVGHRRTGWLTPPNDPRALAEAIREAASDGDLRRRIAANAHSEVRRRFSSERPSDPLAMRLIREITRADLARRADDPPRAFGLRRRG
jgi:glycosyltransferase involved in cell wall biosynthesis